VPAQVVGDDLRLRQVLTNLVTNAIKFTERGEVFIGVHLLEARPDGEVKLGFEVRDTGIGIPMEKQERLFKAFSQVDSSTTRKYGGTGLGLAISEKLVSLMGGEINVKSEPGAGSVFSFTVVTREGTKILPDVSHCDMSDHMGKKVLVVDDNLTNRNVLKGQLENWGLNPVLADSGHSAIAVLLEEGPFDLVLTDMQMPNMDGISLSRLVRKHYPYLPIILLSSIGDEYHKQHFELFNSILTKPIKHHILCKHILTGLQKRAPKGSENKSERSRLPSDLALNYPLNILVAEDNPINQQVVLHILQKLGYKPTIVENGQEAVASVSKGSYDIILMDLQMPEMDGIEATRIIRETMSDPPVIIALTANVMEGDEEECLNAGMSDYIGKPVKLEELVGKLQKWALHRMN
jgi:CheY-like chemotaxis protein